VKDRPSREWGICGNILIMRRKFKFSIGEYYHVYNRGTDKRDIFTNQNDYNRFMVLLHLCNGTKSVDIGNLIREGRSFTELMSVVVNERLVDVGAYCLMPNHFHLLLREKQSDGISLFMKKLLTAYSMYFNNKHKRTGSLFEGRFKAQHANRDEYLKYLFAYIHLNPVKIFEPQWKKSGISDISKAKKFLDNYYYSSYADYQGIKRKEGVIITPESFPQYFSETPFKDYITSWLNFREGPSFTEEENSI
jgi:putative transposase